MTGATPTASPADQALVDHARTGGSTYDPRTGQSLSGKRGWAVGAVPEAASFSAHSPTPDEYNQFAASHADIFAQHENAHVGTHFDPNTGLHSMEVVAVTPSKHDALDLAEHLGENHVHNLATDEKAPSGHEGDRPVIPSSIADRFQTLRNSAPVKQSFSGVHFSDAKLDVIDGSRRGSSGTGQEIARLRGNGGPDAPPGFYAYRAGTLPEPQISTRKNAYPIRGNFAFADAATDPIYQEALNRGGPNAAEHALQDAGYDGYHSSKHPGIHFIFGSHPVEQSTSAGTSSQKPKTA